MAKRRHTTEQIISKLREAEVILAKPPRARRAYQSTGCLAGRAAAVRWL